MGAGQADVLLDDVRRARGTSPTNRQHQTTGTGKCLAPTNLHPSRDLFIFISFADTSILNTFS